MSLSTPSENIRQPWVIWCFKWVERERPVACNRLVTSSVWVQTSLQGCWFKPHWGLAQRLGPSLITRLPVTSELNKHNILESWPRERLQVFTIKSNSDIVSHEIWIFFCLFVSENVTCAYCPRDLCRNSLKLCIWKGY